MLTKGDSFTETIVDLTSEGLGVAKIEVEEGRLFPVFVKDTAIGDKIEGIITKMSKTFAYGKMLKLVEVSKDRTTPECENAKRCGGCSIQHISYEAQLAWKEKFVEETILRIGGIVKDEYTLNDIIPSSVNGELKEYRYRNKGQYPVSKNKNGHIITGFYASRSHDVIECNDCLIENQYNSVILAQVRIYCEKNNIEPYDEVNKKGILRHVLIRTALGKQNESDAVEVMVCPVLNMTKDSYLKNKRFKELMNGLTEYLVLGGEKGSVSVAEDGDDKDYLNQKVLTGAKDGLNNGLGKRYKITSVVLNFNNKDTNVILGRDEVVVYGDDHINDKIGENTYKISAKSFFQINPYQTYNLYEKALEEAGLTGSETVWDLYCGTGTISLFLARKAKEVYGIEIVKEAIENAKDNAITNNINNAYFACGKAEDIKVVDYEDGKSPSEIQVAVDRLQLPKPEVVVVDPPRKGCDNKLLDTIVEIEPAKVVYVSCNISTCARDIKFLSENGYKLKTVTPVDMFPHTTGIENVLLLVREA